MIPEKHRGIPWTKEDVDVAQDLYSKGILLKEISKIIGRSEEAIKHKITDLKIACRRNDWTKEEELQVVSLRSKGLPFKEIGEILKRSDRSVQSKHIRLTTPQKEVIYQRKKFTENYRRVYGVDDDYFHNIDSQSKSYFLGYILADGYVSSSVNTKRQGLIGKNTLGMKLAIKDIEVLEGFRRELKTLSPIKIGKAVTSTYKGQEIKGTKSVTLRVSSEQIVKDLAGYGVVQNKTYICSFPEKLEKKYHPGFIAGLISGDGYIGLKNNHNRGKYVLRGNVVGTYSLISRVREVLLENINYNPNKKIYNQEKCKTLYILELNQQEVLNMYYWMKDAGISLMDRKNRIIEDHIGSNPEKYKRGVA